MPVEIVRGKGNRIEADGTRTEVLHQQYFIFVDGKQVAVIGRQKDAAVLFTEIVSESQLAEVMQAVTEHEDILQSGKHVVAPPPIGSATRPVANSRIIVP